MTVSALLEILKNAKAAGNERIGVGVDIESLNDGNGTANICGITAATVQVVYVADGDGFMEKNKDGSERVKTMLVLRGTK